MSRSTLCFSIPEELQIFKKSSSLPQMQNIYPSELNFGIKIIKKKDGTIDCTEYYSDSGYLVKKCYYNSVYITSVAHYRNNKIFCSEDFEQEKIQRKVYFTKDEKIKSEILYEYSNGRIVAIKKYQSKNLYEVLYKYDELDRINRRILKINDKTVNEQRYRFDILDRIIEYSDNNQRIQIHQISPNNQLIYYTITDKIGNEISVRNNFGLNGYKYTEISMNGHKTTVIDISYVDNIMLKKPYTTEEDLDMILSNLLNGESEKDNATKRLDGMDMANDIIQNNIKSRALPISMRKRVLYNMYLNAS